MPKQTGKRIATWNVLAQPAQPQKPRKPAFTQAALKAVLQIMINSGKPMRFWEIVQANRNFANTNGLQKAARELIRQGKLLVKRDKDGNIYTLRKD